MATAPAAAARPDHGQRRRLAGRAHAGRARRRSASPRPGRSASGCAGLPLRGRRDQPADPLPADRWSWRCPRPSRWSRTGLIECGYGDWEGQPLKKLAKEPLWRGGAAAPVGGDVPRAGESMAAMSARAVAAVRAWDARVTAEHGAGRALAGLQPRRRDQGDRGRRARHAPGPVPADRGRPGSVTVIRYTPGRPFLVRLNDTGGDLAALVPPPPSGAGGAAEPTRGRGVGDAARSGGGRRPGAAGAAASPAAIRRRCGARRPRAG